MPLITRYTSLMPDLSLSSGKYRIFTLNEFIHAHPNKKTSRSSLHNLLVYHQKKGHIIRIRRGLYCIVPAGLKPEECPIDPFLVTSKLTEDSILSYKTALDYFGKLHTSANEFFYMSQKKESHPFHYKNVTYRAVSIPTALKKADKTDFDVLESQREGHLIRVTSLERTFVDILDRPNLCGSWEEIWQSFANIEYLNLDKVVEYTLLLNNATTIAKVGFCLEDHLEQWMVSESHVNELQKHISLQPHYMQRRRQEPQKLVSRWNLLVPLSVFEKKWEEPYGDI